jgi:hypothetical protein
MNDKFRYCVINLAAAEGMCKFFHTVLFAYQKSLKDILGSGEAAFVHPILEYINLVTEKENRSLIENEDASKILGNFLEDLLKKGAVKWVNMDETDDGAYVFTVEGCSFSHVIHEFLDTTDTTCPFGLAVMAYLQLSTGKKVRPTYSEYTKTGTKTVIEFLPQKKKLPAV